MFLELPSSIGQSVQQAAFILNTVLLIASLIIAELVYSEAPAKDRKHLRFFYPMLIVLVGILLYAAYKQGVQA